MAAIIGVLAAVVVPNLARSMRGYRLGVALRILAMAGRYAHNTAIVKHVPVRVTYDLAENAVHVAELGAAGPAVGDAAFGPGGGEQDRGLGVKIVSVELFQPDGTLGSITSGSVDILYDTNGQGQPHELKIVDEFGKEARVTVDELGWAKVNSDRSFSKYWRLTHER